MRYAPPQKIALSKQIKKSLIASAVLLAISFTNVYAEALNIEGEIGYGKEYNVSGIETFDSLTMSIQPLIENTSYAINIDSPSDNLTIDGPTVINSVSNRFGSRDWDKGTYTFRVLNGTLNLNGNISAYVFHDLSPEDQLDSIGCNIFYADAGTINLGNPGSQTIAWALAKKPDLISAKNGGKVHIKSVDNKLVGNIDFLDDSIGQSHSEVTITFSGAESYWFGDDQSWSNTSVKILEPTGFIGALGQAILQGLIDSNNDVLELTFKNGAQWTYFGLTDSLIKDKDISETLSVTAEFTAKQKRISKITLEDGGIINLFDENIQQKWKEIGLLKVWSGLAEVDHDYVRIGNLKGNGGIFRLDLKSDEPSNSDEPSQSDMIFIESSEPGQHFIEPYRPEDLTSVSDTNRLTFALTAEGANSVSFADKQNIYGNSLFDYELIIDYEPIDKKNQELIDKIEELVGNYETFDDFDITDYYNGTHWYIKRLLTKESAASIGMRSAGYASYDLAVNMDRRDRRLQNAVFQNEEKDGLWARVQYGEAGAEHLYNADLTTVYVGYEKAISVDNRLGFSFAYTDGESDLNDLKGSGDLKRYEASVYDTLTFGSHYLDFVARFGQVDNEFDVTNQSGALTTSGSFDQKYAALSAEYGYNFKDEHNVFIEPQVQLQVAYLGDYNYRTERNMKVDADSDISVIGRVGLRTGKTFESSDYVGELYARADVLHQFTDGQDAQFSDLSDKVNVTWGNKDTWSTFGVGGYLNWKDNMSFQVDVERTAGGETIDTWLVSGRVNYLF